MFRTPIPSLLEARLRLAGGTLGVFGTCSLEKNGPPKREAAEKGYVVVRRQRVAFFVHFREKA